MFGKILTSLLLMSVLLCGCSFEKEPVKQEENQILENELSGEASENKAEKIVGNNPPKDVTGWEPMGQYEFDFNGNGEDDVLTLYTSAQRDKKGDMMWDDSQWWVLELKVDNENGVRNLFDERVSGSVYMNVSDFYDEDAQKVVTLFVSGNSSDEVREYRFDGEYYTETIAYTTNEAAAEGISKLYSSVPAYE